MNKDSTATYFPEFKILIAGPPQFLRLYLWGMRGQVYSKMGRIKNVPAWVRLG